MADLTTQQQAAVEIEGDVLVMAGAGTGKTHTLVERVLHFALRADRPVPLDRILVVTFTNAAAAELRRRLRDRLTERYEAAPEDERVAAQLARLDCAAISTIHGYCLRLLREHFHVLGLDPAVSVLEEGEARQLQLEAIETVFEPLYTATENFATAARDLWQRQFQGDVDLAAQTVLQLHGQVQALADPTGWLAAQENEWSAPNPAVWLAALLQFFPVWAQEWAVTLTRWDGSPDNPNAARRVSLLRALGTGPVTRDDAAAALQKIVEQPTETWPDRRKTECRKPLLGLFTEATALSEWFVVPVGGADPLVEDWGWVRHRMLTLLELLRRFQKEFTRRKREVAAVDFTDQEQLALDLLGREVVAGVGTEAAETERARYELVLVDECQDLNAAQDAILRSVSRNGDSTAGNRFLVGDVKQSIYRFRQADPAIFQRYATAWSRGESSQGDAGGAKGRVLTLTENFRSAALLLDFVNGFFPWVLRRELGGVDFGPEATLQFGAPTTRTALSGGGPRVEFHLSRSRGRDESPEDGETTGDELEPIEKMAAEAQRVAVRLRELHASGSPIWDKGRKMLRPVRWSDMAVLLRSEKSRAEDFATAFATAGVPLRVNLEGFFDRLEIRDLWNLVELFDNPLQDIPLTGVLRSPLAGITDVNELAVIRMVRRRENCWWTLLQVFHQAGQTPEVQPAQAPPVAPDLWTAEGEPILDGPEIFVHPEIAGLARRAWAKVDLFLRRFAEWRRLALRGSVVRALEAALDDTGFEAAYRIRPTGATANANLQQFLELTRKFDRGASGLRGGPRRLLRWLKSLRDAGTVPAAVPGGSEAVTLMTIHKSKGLEFPIVAVAALGTEFNRRDLDQGEVMRDAEFGLAPRIHNPTGDSYSGPTRWLARRRQESELLGEELRLLYVALTRAADWLLLFGTGSSTRIEQWQTNGELMGPPFSIAELRSAKSPLDWVGRTITRWANVSWPESGSGETPCLIWRVWGEREGVVSESEAIPLPSSQTPLGASSTVVEPFVYPHAAATHEPAKATVTGLRKRIQLEAAEESGRLQLGRSKDGSRSLNRGESSEPGDSSAVERGLLYHRFMEHVDLSRAGSDTDLSSELERLVRIGRFTAAEATILDLGALVRFWAGPLGTQIRRSGADVRREVPFTLRLDVADLRGLGFAPAPGLADDEFVVVQGVVDLVFLGMDSAWILDFKTDRLPEGEATASAKIACKADDYRPQLAVYALAVERLLGRPVTAGWLHFLASGAEVDVWANEPRHK